MSYTIARYHEIDAGHRVCGHGGKCAHLHGHRYGFELVCEPLSGALDDLGMVADFSVVKSKLCTWLDDHWDHRMLLWVHDPMLDILRDNDPHVTAVKRNPTAENLARIMVEEIAPVQLAGTGIRLSRCVVHETAKCAAEYSASQSQNAENVPGYSASGWTE